MPLGNNDPATDPDFIERQYRAGNNQYALNIEMADMTGFGGSALFGAPLFGGNRWGNTYISPVDITPLSPRRVDPVDVEILD